MAQLKWDFINPVNYGTANQLYQQGNEQISKAIQGAGQAVIGYGEGIKKQQTDDILNALYQAQSPDQLSGAMANVAALQQRYGRGFDQAAVRKEIDARGQTLNQQALGQIQLTQAQNQQEAIGAINAFNQQRAIAAGMSPEQAAQLGNLKVDNTGLVGNIIGDQRDTRDYNHKVVREGVSDEQWQLGFEQSNDHFNKNYALAQNSDSRAAAASDINLATYIAPNAGTSTVGYDSEGNAVTTTQPSRAEALNTAHNISGAYANVRGIRNNNPGNLGFAGQSGAKRENGTGRFASFDTPEAGIAAMSKQIDLFYTGKSRNVKAPAQTVSALINAWAPPNENNTSAYIAKVAKTLGVDPNAKLNMADPKVKTAFMKAVVTHENGGNPYSDAVYAAGLSGGKGTAAAASAAVGGRTTASSGTGALLPQATMAKVTGNYQTTVSKLTNDFNIKEAQAKTKGSLASTGKNVDTWLAGKKETSLFGGGTNPIYTRSADIAAMARAEPAFANLSADAQLKVLDGAHGFVNSTGVFEYVPNKELKKFIQQESTKVMSDSKNQYTVAKQAAFDTHYQELVKEYKAVGAQPPSVEAAKRMFGIESAEKPATAAVSNLTKPKQQAPAKTAASTSVKQAQATKSTKVAEAAKKAEEAKAARQKANAAVAKARQLSDKLAKEKAASNTKAAKPSKQELAKYFADKGVNSKVVPNGINPKEDRAMIREAREAATKLVAKREQEAAAKKEATSKMRAAERARIAKEFSDQQARKAREAQKKREEELRKKDKFHGLVK